MAKKEILVVGLVMLALPLVLAGAVYGDAWPQMDKLLAADGAEWDMFGTSVSISGDYALVGTINDDDNGADSGSAYIFKRDGTTWTQQAKLLAADGADYDYFGYSVSLSGDYALVGAFGDDVNGYDYGSAYIFKRDGSVWTQQAKLTAADGADLEWFGISVSLSGDYALIGAEWDQDHGTASGSAYIFKRDGATWSQQAKMTADDGAAYDLFGHSVSISGDYALVGAYQIDDGNGDYCGSAYIFKRDGITWSQQTKLTASDGTNDDQFGWSVSLCGDYALVGARGDDDKGDASGSAYIFKRDGTVWTQQAKLLAADGAVSDYFGESVSVDGEYALVGAMWNGSHTGSAYIFQRDGTTWSQQAKLTASDGMNGDEFGCSVSLDGDYALVGAQLDHGIANWFGSAYIFAGCPTADLTGDCFVDLQDLAKLIQYWLMNEPSVDIAPPPHGDGIVGLEDFSLIAHQWLDGH